MVQLLPLKTGINKWQPENHAARGVLRMAPAFWGWAMGHEPPPWRPTLLPSGPTLNRRCHGSDSLTADVPSHPQTRDLPSACSVRQCLFYWHLVCTGARCHGGKKVSQPSSNGLTEVGQTDGSCSPLTSSVMKNRSGQQGTRVTPQTGAAVHATTPSGSPGRGSAVQTGSLGPERT